MTSWFIWSFRLRGPLDAELVGVQIQHILQKVQNTYGQEWLKNQWSHAPNDLKIGGFCKGGDSRWPMPWVFFPKNILIWPLQQTDEHQNAISMCFKIQMGITGQVFGLIPWELHFSPPVFLLDHFMMGLGRNLGCLGAQIWVWWKYCSQSYWMAMMQAWIWLSKQVLSKLPHIGIPNETTFRILLCPISLNWKNTKWKAGISYRRRGPKKTNFWLGTAHAEIIVVGHPASDPDSRITLFYHPNPQNLVQSLISQAACHSSTAASQLGIGDCQSCSDGSQLLGRS